MFDTLMYNDAMKEGQQPHEGSVTKPELHPPRLRPLDDAEKRYWFPDSGHLRRHLGRPLRPPIVIGGREYFPPSQEYSDADLRDEDYLQEVYVSGRLWEYWEAECIRRDNAPNQQSVPLIELHPEWEDPLFGYDLD